MQSVSELKAVIDTTFEDITESFGMICMEEKRTPLSIKRFCNNVEALKGQLSKLQFIIQNEGLQRCS